MVKSFWWSSYGCFEAETNQCYPQARQVVAQYRSLCGLSREQVASQLGIGAKAFYYAEYEGRGLDSITRLRELRTVLDIPPALLGLAEAPDAPGWWVRDYEPWLAGADGWPDVAAVIRCYRRAKGWTQSDLALALGVTELTVTNMEHNKGLDSLTRRRALRFLLSIPPLLLGLDAEHYVKEYGGTLLGSRALPSPELIGSFRSSASAVLTSYYSSHAQDRVAETLAWLQEAREVRAMVRGKQRVQMLEVESLGYQALANIEREHASDTVVFGYANRAVQLARDSNSPDVLAIALIRRAETAVDRGYIDLAHRSMNEALLQPISDAALLLARPASASAVLAAGVSDEQGRTKIFALIDQARPASLATPDTFSMHLDKDIVKIHQARALNRLTMHAPQLQARDLLRRSADLLIDVYPQTPRRSIMAKLALSQALIGLNELEGAALLATETLPLMDEIKSVLYLPQLAGLHASLQKGKLRNDPLVLRLGLYLHGHARL